MLKNLNWKKIGLVGGFLIIVIIFILGLYFLFFRPVLTPQPQTNVNVNDIQRLPGTANGNFNIININQLVNGELPILGDIDLTNISDVARGGLTSANKLNAGAILSDSLLVNGGFIYYYNQLDGKFYRINENGERVLLDNKVFYNVEKVNWSPKGDQAILEYPDGSNILYNFNNGQQSTLPKELSDFAFSTGGKQISSELVTNNKESNWLVTASPDGSGMKYIEPLGEEAGNVQTGWSTDNQIIAVFREGIDFERQEIFFLGQNNQNFPSLVVNGRGYEGSWSPNSNTLLYSVYNQDSGYQPTLYLSKTSGAGTSAVYNTGLATWSDKCAFGGSKAYCAVPINLPQYSGLYPQLSQNSIYNFYEIDLTSGNSNLLAMPIGGNGQFFSVANVILSANEDYLYFTDSLSGELYNLQID